MAKENQLYSLIQSLTTVEKAYFKKYAFKKEGKNNASFKRIFDILDKQKSFNIEKIKSNSKINVNIRDRIFVNFNLLQKKIVQSSLDCRKEKDKLSQIFDGILEFEFYREKGLDVLAEKTYKTLCKMTANNDYFLVKPMIHFLPIELMRKYANKTNIKLDNQIEVYKGHIEDARILSETNLLGLVVEKLYKRNSGVLLKTEADKIEAKESLLKTKELLLINKQDAQLKSILINNLFSFTSMTGKIEDFQEIVDDILTIYKDNKDKKTVATAQFDFLVILINLCFFLVVEKPSPSFVESLYILKSELAKIENKEIKQKLEILIFLIDLMNDIFNESDYQNINIEKYLAFNKTIDKKLSNYTLSISFISILFLKFKEYDKIIDVTSELIHQTPNEETIRPMLYVKLTRSFAWLKEENLELFYSEIESIYKYLRKINAPQFSINIVNFIKSLAKKPSKASRVKKLNKFKEELQIIKNNETVSEYRRARFIIHILEIGLL